MRTYQLRRRFSYFALGVVPASYIAFVSGAVPTIADLNEYSFGDALFSVAANLGTIGLWAAALVAVPTAKRWIAIAICVTLVAGLYAMLPKTLVYSFLVIAELAGNDLAKHMADTGGAWKYALDSLLVLWLFIGPVIIAVHFIVKTIANRASNNLLRRSGPDKVPAAGEESAC